MRAELPPWVTELRDFAHEVSERCWEVGEHNDWQPKSGSFAAVELHDETWGHPGADDFSPLGAAIQVALLRTWAADDHLHTVMKCLQPILNPYAVFTVSRAVTENALRIRWLLDDRSARPVRASRACAERLDDLRWRLQVATNERDRTQALKEQRQIVEWAESHTLHVDRTGEGVPTAVGGEGRPSWVDLARDVLTSGDDSGELFYRWLAQTAHGGTSAILIQSRRSEIGDRTVFEKAPHPLLIGVIVSGSALAYAGAVDRLARHCGWQHSWWDKWHANLKPRTRDLTALTWRP